jgi:hypothetical protein
MSSKFSIGPRLQKPPPVCHASKHKVPGIDCYYTDVHQLFAIVDFNTDHSGVILHYQARVTDIFGGGGTWNGSTFQTIQTSIGPLVITTSVIVDVTLNPCELLFKASYVVGGPFFAAEIRWLATQTGVLPFFSDSLILSTDPVPGIGHAIVHS